MKKNIIISLFVVCIITLTGCGNDNIKKESVFECYDLNGDGHQENITLTYEEDNNGNKVFYDGDTKIGTRSDAINYANKKAGGMTCKPGTDR